jgi:hypothetical protein
VPWSGDDAAHGGVELFWIPLGAGGQSVRFNGIVYEAVMAALQRRPRHAIYHSALAIHLSSGRYTVEMTPVPDGRGAERGVVAEGPVGLRPLGRCRLFRYEVRRWRNGVVPDLAWAVDSPVPVTTDALVARHVFDSLPDVPTHTWGRDELGVGDMWSCNSVIAWALESAGIDVSAIPLPHRGRAPGWDAGVVAARSRRRTVALLERGRGTMPS